MRRCPRLLRLLIRLAYTLLRLLMDAVRFLLLCLRPSPALALPTETPPPPRPRVSPRDGPTIPDLAGDHGHSHRRLKTWVRCSPPTSLPGDGISANKLTTP